MWQKVDKSGKSAPAVRTVTIGLDKGREKEAKDGRAATLGERRRWASGDVGRAATLGERRRCHTGKSQEGRIISERGAPTMFVIFQATCKQN